MVKIIIDNLGQKEVLVSDHNKSVLHHFQANYIDWMHACGGKGRCTTCKMVVLEGMENLSSLTPAEKKYRHDGLLLPHERLTCQVRANGDMRVYVPKECQLPHQKYT